MGKKLNGNSRRGRFSAVGNFLFVLLALVGLLNFGTCVEVESSTKGSSASTGVKVEVSSPKYNGASVHPVNESGSSTVSSASGKVNATKSHDRYERNEMVNLLMITEC